MELLEDFIKPVERGRDIFSERIGVADVQIAQLGICKLSESLVLNVALGFLVGDLYFERRVVSQLASFCRGLACNAAKTFFISFQLAIACTSFS